MRLFSAGVALFAFVTGLVYLTLEQWDAATAFFVLAHINACCAGLYDADRGPR